MCFVCVCLNRWRLYTICLVVFPFVLFSFWWKAIIFLNFIWICVLAVLDLGPLWTAVRCRSAPPRSSSSPQSLHRFCQNYFCVLFKAAKCRALLWQACHHPPKGISTNWMLRFHFCSLVTVRAVCEWWKSSLTFVPFENFKNLFILRLDGFLLFLLTLIDSESLSNRNCVGGGGVELL